MEDRLHTESYVKLYVSRFVKLIGLLTNKGEFNGPKTEV